MKLLITHLCQISTCSSRYASGGISPSPELIPTRELKNLMLWRSLPFVESPSMGELFRPESVASLNESIIREIITGRYPKPVITHLSRRIQAQHDVTYTTVPLTRGMKNISEGCHLKSRLATTHVTGRSCIDSFKDADGHRLLIWREKTMYLPVQGSESSRERNGR